MVFLFCLFSAHHLLFFSAVSTFCEWARFTRRTLKMDITVQHSAALHCSFVGNPSVYRSVYCASAWLLSQKWMPLLRLSLRNDDRLWRFDWGWTWAVGCLATLDSLHYFQSANWCRWSDLFQSDLSVYPSVHYVDITITVDWALKINI